MSPDGGRQYRQRGFTLIEILLVVVIIAVLMGVAVISLNPQDMDRRLMRARDQLQGQIRYAQVVAVTDQVEIGVQLLDERWRFLRFRPADRRWLVVDNDAALKSDTVPGLILTWRDQDAERAAPPHRDPAVAQPDFLLMSTGEATPGLIILAGEDAGRLRQRELILSDLGEPVPAEERGHAP